MTEHMGAKPGTPSAAAGRKRLRREPGGRHEAITIRLSKRELAHVEAIAARDGVSTQRLMLESTLAQSAPTATQIQASRREFRTARHQVGVIAKSLSEIAEAVAAGHPLPPNFDTVLARADRLLLQLSAAKEALDALQMVSER